MRTQFALQHGFYTGFSTGVASRQKACQLGMIANACKFGGAALAVQLHGPDVLVCRVVQANEAFFSVTRQPGAKAPCAVLVLTDSLDANAIAASMAAGVHAYVVDGYSAHRLPALVQLAQACFKHEATLAQALVDAAAGPGQGG